MPQSISSSVQLLVEGREPEGFFEALIKHGAFGNVQLHNFGGINELRPFLHAFAKMPDFCRVTSVGIIRDAEQNPAGAFESVQNSLRYAGMPVPDAPGQRAGEHPAVAVMILPDNKQAGMLETLLCESFADDPVNTCINSFFQCLEKSQGHAAYRPFKARARVFLATRPDPHLSVGVAAKRGYWNLDHTALEPIRTFLHELNS